MKRFNLRERIQEASSWAGISLLATVLAPFLGFDPTSLLEAIWRGLPVLLTGDLVAFLAIAGPAIAAIILKERGAPDAAEPNPQAVYYPQHPQPPPAAPPAPPAAPAAVPPQQNPGGHHAGPQ